MGNSAGILSIKLDHHGVQGEGEALYIAGDTVKGVVSINFQAIESRFPGKPLDFKILLEISGKERSKICLGQIARKAERVLLYNQTLLHHVSPDQVWKENGWVDFGFSLEIPSSMPSSFRCDAPGRSYAEITYKLRAVIELTDPSSSAASLRNSLSAARKERTITIRAVPIPPIVVPWMMQPTSHPIKAFGISSKGFIIFGVLVNDTHVGPGETLTISFACRNHSTIDVEKMYIKLVETVSWILDTTKQMKSVERVLHQQEETMHVPQQQSRDLWYETSISGVTTAEDDSIALYNDLKAQKQVLRVKIPADSTNDDYAGPLVKCTHHLEIRVKTEDHVDDPRVQVPLQFKQFKTCSQSHTKLRKQSMMVTPQAHRCHTESKTSLGSSTASQEITIPERQGSADIHVPSYDEYSGNEVMTSVGEREDTARAQHSAFRSGLRVLNSTTQESTTRDVSNSLKSGYSTAASSLPDTQESTRDIIDNLREENITSTLQTRVEIPLSRIRTGGRVRDVPTSIDSDSNLSQTSWFSSNPEPSTELQAVLPSFENLLEEMLFSVDDFDIVCSKLEDPEWRPIFFRISPDEFGSMLAHVNLDHDQPKVAAIVAGQISLESGLTCQHIIHALRNAADWTRASIVQRLLPFCSDLLESKELLSQELTPWELTVLAGDLEKAVSNRLSHRSEMMALSYLP